MRQGSPPQQQQREMMPPPPRPNKDEREDKLNPEDIGDSLFGVGINLKDEENYIHSMYDNRHTQNNSFSTNQNTSFGSSTMSPNNSFNLLTQGTSFGSQDAHGAFAGTLGQAQSQEDIEIDMRGKREAAAKALAERKQHHLNNQFLLCNNVRKRMDRLAHDQGVTLSMHGVYLRQPEPTTTVMTNGAGNEGIAMAKEKEASIKKDDRPESVVNQGAPFEHVVCLLSLAAGERIRGLLDESFSLARARRYGDHGRVVPPEFADIAEGEGKQSNENVVPENVTGSQWDALPNSSDPTATDAAGKAPSTTPQPQSTLSFQGTLNTHLRTLAEKDKQAEKERLAKRAARRRAAAATNGEDAPADIAAVAPEEPAKISKKEQAKQQKEKNNSTEAQLHTTTNQTAAMMAMGKKGSKYSWMTGGSAALPTNRYVKPASNNASGTATPVKQEPVTTPGASAMVKSGSAQGVEAAKELQWGDWREDGVGGKGIQVRDWVLVLERDGREKVALQKVVNRMT